MRGRVGTRAGRSDIWGLDMKKILFFTFLGVFCATVAIALLGITGQLQIDEFYLRKLFYLVIAESVVPVIGLFKKTDFFGDEGEQVAGGAAAKVSVVMLPKESFPRSLDPHQCKVSIYNSLTDEEKEMKLSPLRSNGHLSTFLDSVGEDELIKVAVRNSNDEAWESDYFKPSLAKAEMVKL